MTRTNAYSILCVFTRAFAMWIFVATVVAMSTTFHTVSQWDPQNKWTYFLIGNALPMTVAVLVWIFADKLARLALARPQQIVFESDIAASEWQAVAFSVVGLWQAFAGIVGLTIHLAGMLMAHAQLQSANASADWPPQYIGNLVASGVQLLLGLALMFGSRGLVGLIRRYRQVGYAQGDAIQSPAPETPGVAKPDPPPPA